MTSHPLYIVQQKVRDYGLDGAYEYVWLDDSGDCNEVEDDEIINLLDEVDNYMQELPGEYKNYTKSYYRDRWEFVTLFFTEKGARSWMESNRHRYNEGELRLYVDSAYRNEELKVIQGFLKELK
jgi:hypothetical protein